MTERIKPYWLVTTAVYFGGIVGDKWQPAVRVCSSYKSAQKAAKVDSQYNFKRDPDISGPFYKKMPSERT